MEESPSKHTRAQQDGRVGKVVQQMGEVESLEPPLLPREIFLFWKVMKNFKFKGLIYNGLKLNVSNN